MFFICVLLEANKVFIIADNIRPAYDWCRFFFLVLDHIKQVWYYSKSSVLSCASCAVQWHKHRKQPIGELCKLVKNTKAGQWKKACGSSVEKGEQTVADVLSH